MHLKKLFKIGEFGGSHFNIEDGTNYATFFGILSFIISRTFKNATDTQKEKDLRGAWRKYHG